MLPKQTNPSLIDGIRCLQAVVTHPEPIGVFDIAAQLGLEKTRVHRLLRTLAHNGLLQQNSQRKYYPGPALPILATQTMHALGIGHRAIPPLQRLRKNVNRIVAMGGLWDRTVSYFFHASPGHILETAITHYEPWPASESGIGMALLAGKGEDEIRALYAKPAPEGYPDVETLLATLRTIRAQGYAYVATHYGTHHTLALPLQSNPHIAAGISGEIGEDEVPELLALLRECVAEIDAAKIQR